MKGGILFSLLWLYSYVASDIYGDLPIYIRQVSSVDIFRRGGVLFSILFSSFFLQ